MIPKPPFPNDITLEGEISEFESAVADAARAFKQIAVQCRAPRVQFLRRGLRQVHVAGAGQKDNDLDQLWP